MLFFICLQDVGVADWADIYCPSLIALEKVVVSCLLETLQSTYCGLAHNAVREGIQEFDTATAKER